MRIPKYFTVLNCDIFRWWWWWEEREKKHQTQSKILKTFPTSQLKRFRMLAMWNWNEMNTLNTQQSMFIWDVIYNRRIKLNFPRFNQANELKSVPMNTRRTFFSSFCVYWYRKRLDTVFCLTLNCTFPVVKQHHSLPKMRTRYAYSLKLWLHDYSVILYQKFQGRVLLLQWWKQTFTFRIWVQRKWCHNFENCVVNWLLRLKIGVYCCSFWKHTFLTKFSFHTQLKYF